MGISPGYRPRRVNSHVFSFFATRGTPFARPVLARHLRSMIMMCDRGQTVRRTRMPDRTVLSPEEFTSAVEALRQVIPDEELNAWQPRHYLHHLGRQAAEAAIAATVDPSNRDPSGGNPNRVQGPSAPFVKRPANRGVLQHWLRRAAASSWLVVVRMRRLGSASPSLPGALSRGAM